MSYLVYILKSDHYSYVGMTNDFLKRFRQHNQEIKGGAKYTSRREGWYPVCIIDGFQTMKEAMQCEWAVKHSKHLRGLGEEFNIYKSYYKKINGHLNHLN